MIFRVGAKMKLFVKTTGQEFLLKSIDEQLCKKRQDNYLCKISQNKLIKKGSTEIAKTNSGQILQLTKMQNNIFHSPTTPH